MTYRSLLVLVDQDPLCSARTKAAIGLAQSFDAHLTGFAPTGLVELPGAPAAAASLAEFAAAAWDSLRVQAHAAAHSFDKACVAAEFSACESIVEEADFASALLNQANCHDLTLLSQPDPDTRGHAAKRELIEQIVLFSARPTLVLPCAGSLDAPYQNVMVAWDGSREAARAVADALPLLRKARRVSLVAWQEKGLLTRTDPVKLDEVCKWLAWHSVSADAHLETAFMPITESMLSRAADLDADLLVMGAYGHTRWTERVLGGATRGVLASMTVPVLMSH